MDNTAAIIIYILTGIALLIIGITGWIFLRASKKYDALIAKAKTTQQQADTQRAKYVALQETVNQYHAQLKAVMPKAQQKAAAMLERTHKEAQAILVEAHKKAEKIKNAAIRKAEEEIQKERASVQEELESARKERLTILLDMQCKANKIKNTLNAERATLEQKNQALNKANQALQRIISGYTKEYLENSQTPFDQIAEIYSKTEAAQAYKKAKEEARRMIRRKDATYTNFKNKSSASAIANLLLLAFNGRVDGIVGNIKNDNYSKLIHEINDTATMINTIANNLEQSGVRPEFVEARQQELTAAHRMHLLKQLEKEEQRAIREQMREEQKAQAELIAAERKAEQERALAEDAYEKAKQELQQASQAEKESLQLLLQEKEAALQQALERQQRAISMAQQTKCGHCYIISNIGSFGEGVYKIGMTRRLDPMDRVYELGDASVPFPFDVHAMIYSEDCPALENYLHKTFANERVNLINQRKEFFRVNISQIQQALADIGVNAHWTLTAIAEQWRESEALRAGRPTQQVSAT